MIEQLIPVDNVQEDTDRHMNIWRLTEQPIESTNDREFTQDVLREIIEVFNPRKAPGPDGITREILILVLKSIPKTVTSIYNESFKRECFPLSPIQKSKITKIIPVTKPDVEDSLSTSKKHPISFAVYS